MTLTPLIRPVFTCVLVALASGCGMVESDPNRFETMAGRVADIPVSMDRPGQSSSKPIRSAQDSGLRGARAPLKVEVMDPHDLWDARDGIVQDAVSRAAPAMAQAAVPLVVQAVQQEVTARTGARPSERLALRPAIVRPATVRPGTERLVQLGAFASQDAARTAWTRLKSGTAARFLADSRPVYEAVEVNGRRLIRLKVAVPEAGAAAVCAAARINDPWCTRGA